MGRRRAFIFIGGLQPRKIELDGPKRLCPACRRETVRWVRVDQFLSLFFIPLFTIKAGQPYLECQSCGQAFDPTDMEQRMRLAELRPAPPPPAAPQPEPGPSAPEADAPAPCRFCGKDLKEHFKYCPYCGARIQ